MSKLADESSKAADSDEDFQEVPDSDKTPVTIVTGFLGSGKTTLVNYILKEQHGWKICVVENEFGEVSIDDDLVNESIAAREDLITMDNGCVCCSVRGDLVRTFGQLVARRKEFDAIIIETTGLADPAPICFTFGSNALMQDNYRIDAVVCLVDAKHVNIHLDEAKPEGSINEAEHQIAFADRIVVNKLDLVSKDELADVVDRIKSMNSFAKIVKTEKSKAPLDQILGIGAFSLEKCAEIDPEYMETILEQNAKEEAGHGHVHDEHCTHDHGCEHECTLDHDHSAHEHGHGHGHGHGHEHHEEPCTLDHDHSAHDHKDHHHEEHHKEHHEEHHKEHHHEHHKEHHDHHKEHHDHHKEHHDHHKEHEDEQAKKKSKKHNLSLVSSVGFTIKGELDTMKFNTFMSDLLAAKAADLYRTKGVLNFSGQGDTKFVFQGVHEQITFGPAEKPWTPNEERVSKMVFIGKNLDYEFFKKSLEESVTAGQQADVKMHKRAA